MDHAENFVVIDVFKRIFTRYKEEAMRQRWPEVTKDVFYLSLSKQYSATNPHSYEDLIKTFRSTPEIIGFLKSSVLDLPHEFISRDHKEKVLTMLTLITPPSHENTDQYLAANSPEINMVPEPSSQAHLPEAQDLKDEEVSDTFLPQEASAKKPANDNPLRQLHKPKTHKSVKKEYFRCQHIRAIKKSIREFSRRRFPKTSIAPQGKMTTVDQRFLWFQLENLYNKYPNELNAVSDPSPRIGGSDGGAVATKSYSDTYVRHFFAQKAVRGFHFLFCDLVYGSDINDLCEKLRAKCCARSEHSEKCELLWAEVKDFAKFDMIEELGYLRNVLKSEEEQFAEMFNHFSAS